MDKEFLPRFFRCAINNDPSCPAKTRLSDLRCASNDHTTTFFVRTFHCFNSGTKHRSRSTYSTLLRHIVYYPSHSHVTPFRASLLFITIWSLSYASFHWHVFPIDLSHNDLFITSTLSLLYHRLQSAQTFWVFSTHFQFICVFSIQLPVHRSHSFWHWVVAYCIHRSQLHFSAVIHIGWSIHIALVFKHFHYSSSITSKSLTNPNKTAQNSKRNHWRSE